MQSITHQLKHSTQFTVNGKFILLYGCSATTYLMPVLVREILQLQSYMYNRTTIVDN